MPITIVLFWVRTRKLGQRYNVPVLQYRTPLEYAGQTPYMNDKLILITCIHENLDFSIFAHSRAIPSIHDLEQLATSSR